MSSNLQNILDNALTEFFSTSTSTLDVNLPLYDICYSSLAFNYLNFEQNLGRPNLVEEEEEVVEEAVEEEETKSNSGDSIPDLIPIDNIEEQEQEQEQPIMESSQPLNQQITLWYQLIEDYNTQISTYQQNICSIINITENILPVFNNTNRNRNRNRTSNTNSVSNANTSRQNLITQLRNLFRNNEYTASPYILEFENITPLVFSQGQGQGQQSQGQGQGQGHQGQGQGQQVRPLTSQEIQNATELFIHDSRNQLIYNTCPITLEEFREGEPLIRIRQCGHIFKAFELQRWFLRNTKCPSCRYDIRTAETTADFVDV